MRYWWVNHKKTVRQEITGGYLWSPKRTRNDRRSQFYDNMREARQGDWVVSFASARIAHIGRVTRQAFEGEKPDEYGPAGENWNSVGWRLPVDWMALPKPVQPKLVIEEIRPWLEAKYSPYNATHVKGNEGAYFAAIPEELFRYILERGEGQGLWNESAASADVSGAAGSAGAELPSIYIYMIEMLDTLRAFGGAATSDQVCDWFVERGVARDRDIDTIQKHGETRFRKEVRFARLALAKAGLLQGNDRGYWCLSRRGWNTHLTVDEARIIANGRRPPTAERLLDNPGLGDRPHGRSLAPGPSKGPRPVPWEGVVRRLLATGASTYVMRFGATRIWKIGYASNVTKRLAELNRHVPVEVLKRRWELVREERWREPSLAYEMEQRLLGELKGYYTHGERVRCTEQELAAAWERVKN